MSTLEQTRALVRSAAGVFSDAADRSRLDELERRLAEPLRVAVAGRVKAGKSTLLNALAGDRLAATDAGECTRIVTWYSDSHTARVRAEPIAGEPRHLAFRHTGDTLRIDLGGLAPEDVARLLVEWPSRGLRAATLIDTPGIGSLSAATSQRAWDLIAAEDEETPADAVLYLVRHLHTDDVAFLHAFHDDAVSRVNPINAIGVLSRADEVGACRLDAMTSARGIAERMSADPTVRRMVQTVVPVAGLIAETAETLAEAEFADLRRVSALAVPAAERLLLTADRFVDTAGEVDLDRASRQHLLERFGLFGVRLAVTLLRHRLADTSSGLAAALLERSGLQELRQVLDSMFLERRDVLKARSALFAVESLARANPGTDSDRIAAEAERIIASAHAFRELRVLSAIRSGWVQGKEAVVQDAERLVGGGGVQLYQRLGLDPDADEGALRSAAAAALERWQRRAESPMTELQLVAASRVVIQSCEGMLADLHGWR